MSNETVDLKFLNTTELLTIIRQKIGVIVKRSVPNERLIQMVTGDAFPDISELAGTMETRRELEVFVGRNWDWVQSQLPCTGENRGKCTVYPCPEGRHLDCYLAAKRQSI